VIQFTAIERFDAGTNEEYHAGPGVSNSKMSRFLDDPALYDGLYNTGLIEPSGDTPDRLLGTALHEMTLEGGLQTSTVLDPEVTGVSRNEYLKIASKFRIATRIPDHVLNEQGYCRGKPYTDWAKLHKGSVLMKSEEFDQLEQKVRSSVVVPEGQVVTSNETYDQLRDMEDALRAHDSANRLLFGEGESEVPLIGEHAGTGILTRCKLDRYSETAMGGFVADLKTVRSASPKGFANAVADFGYARQRVLYGSMVNALLGREVPFHFVCVEKKKPYRVEVYELEPAWIDQAVEEIEKAFRGLRRCESSGIWKHEHYGDVLSLPMPNYLNYKKEWEAS